MQRNNYKILREIVFNLLGGKCNKCGSNENIHLHHKDGNFKNNDSKNLILFCKKCHEKLHGIKLNNFYNFNADNKKLFFWKCPECRKEIKSLFENQLNYNKRMHQEKHKRKNNKK